MNNTHNKIKILLQCQALTYLYMGLGAIYTKYKGHEDELEIDVVLTCNEGNASNFIEKIQNSKYVNNVILFQKDDFGKNIKRINKLKKNVLGKFLFNFYYKNNVINIIKSKIGKESYSDIFFNHELPYFLITFLKFIYPNAKYNTYGDGSGLLIGKDCKLINPFKKPYEFKFFDEIKPDNIIALCPIIEDDSFNPTGIPVIATDSDILLNLIKNDHLLQKEVNDYANNILEKYSDVKNKILLLATRLEDKRFKMKEEEQVNIYLDIINKYCPEESLVILKLHPTTKIDIASILKEKCTKNYIFEIVPSTLKEYPVEIYAKLITNMDLIITFLSSSRISISELYKVKTTDAYDVIQNYPLKDRVNFTLNVYNEALKLLPAWDRKSVVYQCDIVPQLKEFYEKNGGYN